MITRLAALLMLPLLGSYAASYAIWRSTSGNLVTALHSGWSDMLLHIRAVIFFAEQGTWPNQSFLLAGQPIGYAYAADLISSWLYAAGLSLENALAIPTMLLTAIWLFAFEYVVWKFTKSVTAAITSLFLFTAFGGLNGWYLLPTLLESDTSLLETMRALPHGITAWHEANMVLLNPFVMTLHQRAYLLGLPLLLLLIYRGSILITHPTWHKAGVVSIIGIALAFCHPFTWLASLLILISWALWDMVLTRQHRTYNHMYKLTVTFGIIAIIGYAMVKSLQPNAGAAFLAWRPGWLDPTVTWPLFWLKNIGLYCLLLPCSLYYFIRHRHPLASLTLASFTPFIAANLIQFAPWEWDNTKILAPTWCIFAITVGSFLSLYQPSRMAARLLLLALSLPLLTLSGALEIARVPSYRDHPMPLARPVDEKLGEKIRSLTQPDDILLTAPHYQQPAFIFSGRPSFVAYEGWLGSHGWRGHFEQRLADTHIMYSGSPVTANLLRKHNIAHVVIGPDELAQGANRDWYQKMYRAILDEYGYQLFTVK